MITEDELTPARIAAARARKKRLLAIAAKGVPDTGIDLHKRPTPKIDTPPPPEPETAQAAISVETEKLSPERDWILTSVIESREARYPFDYIDRVISTVCGYFQISSRDLKGVCREDKFVTPRHIAMYLANKANYLSNAAICRHFKRDHTCGIHAVRKIEKWLLRRPDIQQAVYEIEAKLNEYLVQWRLGL